MLLQAINLTIAKRVRTDLIIGADNHYANIERTNEWARYAQSNISGAPRYPSPVDSAVSVSPDMNCFNFD